MNEEKIKILKNIKEETRMGMMDCKKALMRNEWNEERAKEELKKIE